MKCMIFIDGGNLFHSVKEHNNRNNINLRIDFIKLSEFLTNHTGCKEHLRTYFYTGVPVNVNSKQLGFLTKLNLLPNFEVKKKTLKIKNGKYVEKGVDVQIVTDMLWNGLKKHCEHVILVSGDEDLTDAVDKLKDNGIRVTVAAFKQNTSKKIIKSADNYIELSQYLEKLRAD